jgi:site-specific recombinase XerC
MRHNLRRIHHRKLIREVDLQHSANKAEVPEREPVRKEPEAKAKPPTSLEDLDLIASAWLDSLSKEERRVREGSDHASVKTYLSAYRTWTKYLSLSNTPLAIDNMTREDGEQFIEWLQNAGYRGSSIRTKVSAICNFWEFLIKQGLVQSNPFAGLRAPLSPKNHTSPLTGDEDRSIFDDGDLYNYHLAEYITCLLMRFAGLRLSEVGELGPGDLTLNPAGDFLRIHIHNTNGEERSGLFIPFYNELQIDKFIYMRDLLSFIKLRINKEKLIPYKPRALQHFFSKRTAQGQMPTGFTLNRLRVTLAAWLMSLGATKSTVSEILGYPMDSRSEYKGISPGELEARLRQEIANGTKS